MSEDVPDDDQHSIASLEDDDAQMLSHEDFTDMLTPDDIETPDELEESIMERECRVNFDGWTLHCGKSSVWKIIVLTINCLPIF